LKQANRRTLLRGGGALALGTLLTGQNALAAAALSTTAPTDPYWFVNPELRQAASKLPKIPPDFTFTDAMLPMLRKQMPEGAYAPPSDIQVVQRKIRGLKAAPDVLIYIVNAKPGTPRPAILYTHGGGLILGTAYPDRHLLDIARQIDCVIVSVDYRLAPETRWQGSTEDDYAGLKWLHDNADALGADRSRIAVMGESSGGTHAALLALSARDRGEVPLVLQVLIYPMLDDRTGSSRQVAAPMGVFNWTAGMNRYGWRSFLGQEPGTADVPVQAVPARATNLAGLPPAFMGVGTIDLFFEEDVEYARRLVEAGVPTELDVVPGAFHGFDGAAPEASIVKEFRAAELNALRRAFGIPVPI